MLVELSANQSTLRSKPTLEIPVLLVHDLQEISVIGTDSQLRELHNLIGLGSESVDCVTQFRDTKIAGATADHPGEFIEVDIHLVSIVGNVERDEFCGCQVVRKEREVLSHRRVDMKARIAEGSHPVVRVVVAVVGVQWVSGATLAAHVDL
jgi:hypothetical protein